MVRINAVANYAVRYNSDPRLVTGQNHKSDDVYLTDTDELNFNHLCDALNFLSECTSSITKVEDLIPELKNMRKYKYLLPDSHIKVKHRVIPDAEIKILNSDLDWS